MQSRSDEIGFVRPQPAPRGAPLGHWRISERYRERLLIFQFALVFLAPSSGNRWEEPMILLTRVAVGFASLLQIMPNGLSRLANRTALLVALCPLFSIPYSYGHGTPPWVTTLATTAAIALPQLLLQRLQSDEISAYVEEGQ